MTDTCPLLTNHPISFVRKGSKDHLLIIITGEQAFPGYLHAVSPEDASILTISVPDWNRDLSPWPEKACFKGSEAFRGEAKAFLRAIQDDILPKAERALGLENPVRSITGYSLAGLFALYAMFETELFTNCASVSGSLWYEGFLDYIKKRKEAKERKIVYLSLGDREELTRNERLSKVGVCTKETAEILKGLKYEARFEYNKGNHFFEPEKRMLRAIDFIFKK